MFVLLQILLRLLAWIDFAIFTLALNLLACLPTPLLVHFYPQLFRIWCRTFLRALGIDLHLHQHYAGTLPRQFILIANHPSALEDIGIPALFNVRSLAKAEVARWWLFGPIARAAGTLFVQREERASRASARTALISAVAQGHNIALFPEGGCKGRRIAPHFHYGAFTISLATGIPVLPVFLVHEAQEDFEWRPGVSLPVKIWQMLTSRNRSVHYHVFAPFEPGQFADCNQYCHTVHQAYLAWQQKLLD